jgi:hypothetical protein
MKVTQKEIEARIRRIERTLGLVDVPEEGI